MSPTTGPALDDELPASLRRFSELPPWLAQVMDPHRARAELLRHVPELADGRQQLVGCVPSRLRNKEEGWLARYELVLAEPGSAGTREVVLTGELEPPGGPSAGLPAAPSAGTARGTAASTGQTVESSAKPSDAQTAEQPGGPAAGAPAATAVSTGLFGAPDWAGWLPGLRLRLRTATNDAGLLALPELTDPEAARDLLERALAEQAFPGIRIAAAQPEVVRYKPGSRCTLIYRLRYTAPEPGWPDTVVVKTYQGDKGANAFAAMDALWECAAARTGPVRLARPLAYLPESRVLVQSALPGTAGLSAAIRSAVRSGDPRQLAGLRTRLARTAEGLAALHRSGVRHGRLHTWADELAELRGLAARLSVTIPELGDAADPLLTRLQRFAAITPAGPPGPAHHDFRPGQVMLDGTDPQAGEIAFIDFDGFCTAEPALDVGRFRAKLRDIGVFAKDTEVAPPEGEQLAARVAVLDELCDGFLAAYQTHAPVSSARVLLWETTDLLTAVLHAWTKVRLVRVTPRLALLEHQLARLAR